MPETKLLQILVPTDFSPSADKALDFAVLLARKTLAKVLILHIFQIPVLPVRGAHFTDTEKGHENMAIAEQKLRYLVQRLGGLADIDVGTKSSPMYGPIEIPEIIKLQSADMIIMGTKQTGTLTRWIMGTNAAVVIENAACPVLIIPEDSDCQPLKKIGVAYDGLPIEDLARFDFLLQFAGLFDARIDIFHFRNPNQEITAAQYDQLARLQEYLGGLMDEFYEIEDQDMAEGIHQTVEEKQIDVIVMLPRSKTVLERLLKGSMTKKIIFRVKTGVMVLPE